MNIFVAGGTGRTGRHVVDQLLARGDTVTLLTRHAGKVSPRAGLIVLEGDGRDPHIIRKAVQGQDAVVMSIGPDGLSKKDNAGVQGESTRLTCEAMKEFGVRRLVVVSSMGVGESRSWLHPVSGKVVLFVLRHALADKEVQEAAVKKSGLDWVLVRPGQLTDEPARGTIAVKEKARFGPVARADVATFVVAQLTGNEWLGRGPTLGYGTGVGV